MSESELREDISVLNVVNFGGGAYVIYAEVLPNGEIEVDPEPYSDTFDRPARLLPIEAKALVAAIDLIGPHLAKGALDDARGKIVAALGFDPVEEGLQVTSPTVADDIAGTVDLAVHEQRLLELEYYAPNEDRFSHRTVEPYALFNSTEAWYVAAFDPEKDDLRHFRLDRIKSARLRDETFERRPDLDPVADIGGWPSGGRMGGSHTARVWISPDQARWAGEDGVGEKPNVLARLRDGAIVVEWPYKGTEYLVRAVLKEAGDAVVLEPADAREAVLAAAERLLAPTR
jgi:proteasome accessory factor C